MSQLVVEDLSVEYTSMSGDRFTACTDINLTIESGEFVTIIGPSGCGKSTLLHCLGGLLQPSGGSVKLGESVVDSPDPHKASFVFQDYSLFPWKSVVDNVGMGLKFAGGSKKEVAAQAREKLEFVGLTRFADRYPRELSGGMQQRVSLARALALEPQILLMDEPFGALDEQTRRALGEEMSQILRAAGQTVVLITHSLDEAIFWADRIVVMSASPGRIAEVIEVKHPQPRDLSFMATEEFQQLRVHLFEKVEFNQLQRGPKVSA